MTDSKQPEYDYSIYYRDYHDDTDQHAARMAQAHVQQLKPLLPPPGPQPVLDIGCGMGFALLAMRDMGFTNVSGVDSDVEQVKQCRRRGLAVEQVDDTIAFLGNAEQRFQIILLMDVLEHIPVPLQILFLRAIYKALQAGGRLILTVPNATSMLASRWLYNDYTHHSSFTEHSLNFVLKNAGFETVRILDGKPVGPRPSLRLWKLHTRHLFRDWLVRAVWRQVLISELGEEGRRACMDLNLTALADKAGAS